MEEFKLGDKVRSKMHHNIMGIISKICWDHWYGQVDQVVTVRVMSEEGYMRYETFNATDIEKIDEEKETKDMTTYNVGDSVYHPLYNESIIIDISRFSESGHIEIVPLTGLHRGIPILVSIDNIKPIDNKLIISVEDYNKMANTIENLKKENIKLCAEAKLLAMDSIFGYNNRPEVKEVLYHKPATIIFWKDGTKTVVKCHDRDYFDKEKGFAMACLKKVLGNCGHYYEEVKKWVQ